MKRQIYTLLLTSASLLIGCSGTQSANRTAIDTETVRTDLRANAVAAGQPSKSPKRGIAYNLSSAADLQALSPGVSWWYNWTSAPDANVPSNYNATYSMDYYPMLWNFSFNKANVEAFLRAHSEVKYLLVLNEPNVSGQATCGSPQYCSPSQAAALWPQYEAVAADTGVQLVGPQITWGTDPSYADPVNWLDSFISAYQANNGGRSPRIDFLGFHWYDYGLDSQLTRLAKYGKPFWVTEFANWHAQNDGAQIDTLAKQEAQMKDMVNTGETRADVFRYAWFTGRVSPDPHFSSLLGASGQLTGLGQTYITLPFTAAASASTNIDAGSPTAQGDYVADKNFSGGSTSSTTHSVTLAANDTAPAAVYATYRLGSFTYTFTGFAPGSAHTLALHFAETYWTQPGQRVFNVTVNGTMALSNFDIIATAGGPKKTVVKTLTTSANSSGQITIHFSPVKDNALLNAIEVD